MDEQITTQPLKNLRTGEDMRGVSGEDVPSQGDNQTHQPDGIASEGMASNSNLTTQRLQNAGENEGEDGGEDALISSGDPTSAPAVTPPA